MYFVSVETEINSLLTRAQTKTDSFDLQKWKMRNELGYLK